MKNFRIYAYPKNKKNIGDNTVYQRVIYYEDYHFENNFLTILFNNIEKQRIVQFFQKINENGGTDAYILKILPEIYLQSNTDDNNPIYNESENKVVFNAFETNLYNFGNALEI